MVGKLIMYLNRGEYASVKKALAFLLALLAFFKFIWPLLKRLFNTAGNGVADIQAAVAGLNENERRKYDTDAKSVAIALGTNEDRDIWLDTSWMAEDEKTAYGILKNYVGKLDIFDIYYAKHTGGNSIITDIHKYFTGSDAKYKRALGL